MFWSSDAAKRADDRNASTRVEEQADHEKFEYRDTEKDAGFVVEEVQRHYIEIELAKLAGEMAAIADVQGVAKL